MKSLVAICAALLPALPVLVGAQPAEESVDTLIKKLGSANFQQRQAATEALKRRPDAAPLLRDAARSSDLETSRRIAGILEYHETEPVRRLQAAAKDGNVEDFIQILGSWQKGRAEAGAWREFCTFVKKLVGLHEPKVADDGGLWQVLSRCMPEKPLAYSSERVTEATLVKGLDADGRQFVLDGRFFLRIGEMDFDHTRPGRENVAHLSHAIVATRSARFEPFEPQAVFVGGALEILRTEEGGSGRYSVYVSCGDIVFDSCNRCLIIARGKVTCKHQVVESRIISGKSVIFTGRQPEDCIITENEPNPLGFIRWADAPRDKAAPKAELRK